jgi:hypothetical protein
MADGPVERGPNLGQPALRLHGIETSSIVKALGQGTTQLDQMGILQCGLHTFGHHNDAEGASQPDHRLHKGLVLLIDAEPLHEGAIDLEDGDRETAPIAQG